MVRRELGYGDMPNSYVKFLIQQLTGIELSATVVDFGTAIGFFGALLISLYLNFKDFRQKRIVY